MTAAAALLLQLYFLDHRVILMHLNKFFFNQIKTTTTRTATKLATV
jgi:hypothetical protein